jgi:hypothetical protein
VFAGPEPRERKLQRRLERLMRHATGELGPRATGHPNPAPGR